MEREPDLTRDEELTRDEDISDELILDRRWAREAPHELSAHGRRVAARLQAAPTRGPVRPSLWKRARFAAWRLTHR